MYNNIIGTMIENEMRDSIKAHLLFLATKVIFRDLYM